jgi:serine/threonine-protein kinase
MSLTPGLLLADRYRLTGRIAVGGMGEVWAADDTRLARTIAVKILKSELTSDPEFVDRFRAEARITASLNSPGIAAVYDYGEVASIAGGPRDTAYLVMELVSGEPLSGVLVRTPRLSASRTLDVLEQSGRALQVAHARGLVHRDIKPGNILITPGGQVKITDFGIAKVAHQVPVTRSGMVMGTAQYLSPEQAAGGEAVPASDVYALGVVAYECLAGGRPFERESAIAVATAHVQDPVPPLPADVPPPVAALVIRMLAKNPAERFPDGASLAAACAAVRSGTAMTPTGAPYRVSVSTPVGYRPEVAARLAAAMPRQVGAGQGPPGTPVGPPPRDATGSPAAPPAVAVPPRAVVIPSAPGVQFVTLRPPPTPPRRTWLAVLIVVVVLLLTAAAGVFLVIRANAGAPASTAAPAGHRPAASVAATGTDRSPGPDRDLSVAGS